MAQITNTDRARIAAHANSIPSVSDHRIDPDGSVHFYGRHSTGLGGYGYARGDGEAFGVGWYVAGQVTGMIAKLDQDEAADRAHQMSLAQSDDRGLPIYE